MAQLTDDQITAAKSWYSSYPGCCWRLANQLASGTAPIEAQGCISRCPVTGQDGGRRDQSAIDELARLLAG